MTLADRLDQIAGQLLATNDYSTFAHAIYQAAIELRSVKQPEAELLQLTLKDFIKAVEKNPDAVGVPVYYAVWPNAAECNCGADSAAWSNGAAFATAVHAESCPQWKRLPQKDKS